MLADSSDRVEALMKQGKSIEEIIKAQPNASLDEKLGNGWIKPERFLEFLYNSLLDEQH